MILGMFCMLRQEWGVRGERRMPKAGYVGFRSVVKMESCEAVGRGGFRVL